jgi:hypothetical protein
LGCRIGRVEEAQPLSRCVRALEGRACDNLSVIITSLAAAAKPGEFARMQFSSLQERDITRLKPANLRAEQEVLLRLPSQRRPVAGLSQNPSQPGPIRAVFSTRISPPGGCSREHVGTMLGL